MTFVPPTTKSNRRLGLTLNWRSATATAKGAAKGAAKGTAKGTGSEQRAGSMAKKESLPPDGAAPSSAQFCCVKCPRPSDGLAANVLECTSQKDRDERSTTRPPTPTTPLDKHMPKARNRNQATSALFLPAMHRKSKCKSKCSNSNFNSTLADAVQHQLHTSKLNLNPHTHPESTPARLNISNNNRSKNNKNRNKSNNLVRYKMFVPLPTLGATSFVTLLTILCIETVLLSTMSSCAKTFYMHWNTSNSIFRIDNTDHIIDVNKGNLAFEFDQVHIICPVYEPGAFENETEKYIIYNVSKVEYETCRITNADPRVIAICDKPQKLMFFTITFRPFTPQPGGLEFLPGNDYYFISTSSKDDLYRRIGGRCSTNNMKVVFKVCCAAEEKNKTTETTLVGSGTAESGLGGNGVDNNAGVDLNQNAGNNIAGNTGLAAGGGNNGIQLKPINGMGTSINTNIDQFNRIPIQPNIIGNNIGGGSGGTGGIMLSPGHGSINMLPPGRGGGHMAYPGHHHIQTGIRINNVPTQPNNPHTHHKGQMNNANSNDDHHGYDKHPNEVVKNEELTYNSGGAEGVGRIWSGVNLMMMTMMMMLVIIVGLQRNR